MYQQPEAPKRQRGWLIASLTATGLILLLGLIGILANASDDPTASTSTTASAIPTHSAAPSPSTPASPSATAPSPEPATTTAATKAPAKPAKVTYAKLTQRQWLQIAKNPDRYVGKGYVVYGQITQFDSATGDDTFRADVGGVRKYPSYGYVDYDTNTILTGDAAKLSNFVEDDLFGAQVIVGGSYDYETQIGGNTTVPLLVIHTIKNLGSTKS